MAFLPEDPAAAPDFPSIYQIDPNDLVQGGLEGVANKQAIALAQRDQYLMFSLIQFNNLLSSQVPFLGYQSMPPVNAGFGGIINAGHRMLFMFTRKENDTYQLSLGGLATNKTADIFIKQFGATTFQSTRRSAVTIGSAQVDLLTAPVSFDTQIEIEVFVEDKGYNYKAGVAADNSKAWIWGKNMTLYTPV